MDRIKDIQRLQRFLEEGEEMVKKQKADRDEMDLVMQLESVEADMRRREQCCQYDNYISDQRVQFDKALDTKHSELAKRVRTDMVALMNTVLNDQRATYAQKIEQERALSNEGLEKARQENDATLQNERKIFDSTIDEARAQLVAYENEREKLKTLIESLLQREEVPDNVEVEDMIHIPRRLMSHIIDNECHPRVVMQFKLHAVKQIYPDMQKYYDSREQLAMFQITDPDKVAYWFLSQELSNYYGYTGDAEWYYRNPAPRIEASAALVKIDGQEDVDKMVDAHAHESTKICHMYIVNGAGFYDKNVFDRPRDDDYRPYQCDEEPYDVQHLYHSDEEDRPSGRAKDEAEQDCPVAKKRRADE